MSSFGQQTPLQQAPPQHSRDPGIDVMQHWPLQAYSN